MIDSWLTGTFGKSAPVRDCAVAEIAPAYAVVDSASVPTSALAIAVVLAAAAARPLRAPASSEDPAAAD